MNLGSTSAAREWTASEQRTEERERARFGISRQAHSDKIFEIALDLLFHLRWNALFEGVEDFFAKIARRFVFFFARQAEFFGVQTGEAVFDVELGEIAACPATASSNPPGMKAAALAEQPGHRHVAELAALRHLLHGRLHLLLRLR